MTRQTRTGVRFSPYELEDIHIPAAARHFEVIQVDLSLDSLLQQAVLDDDARAARQQQQRAADENDEWEDDVVESAPPSPSTASPPDSRSSSPMSLCPSSPTSSRSSSPPPTPQFRHPAFAPPPAPPSHSPPEPAAVHRHRRNQQAAIRRSARRRAKRGQQTPYDRAPDPRYSQTHRQQAPHAVPVDLEDVPVTGGAWIGRRSKGTKWRIYTPEELRDEGAEHIRWNGRHPKLIVDAQGRIIAILLGTPEDPDWPDVVKEAIKAMARARCQALRHRKWEVGRVHRRGRYFSLTAGVSFGGGQRRPGNLCNTRFFRHLIRRLLRNKSIRRIVGFQSSGLALYAPKLYRYLCTILRALFEHHPDLIHNFDNSIFPGIAFNCGDVVTFEHCDQLNLLHSFCPVTSGGDFDHTKGGHLYLRQLNLFIDFPANATILIPSGCLEHGNTPIQDNETRYSITQFAAGGLFRWVAYGFQTAKSLLSQVGGKGLKDGFDGVPGSRWRWALDLFSKYDELDADRAAVFGPRT